MKKKSSGSLKESFVQSIENKILSGELKIGDKLPPEREIVETMGISLTVVNAGIAELAGKGFVEVRPRQGVFVTDYIHKGTMETLVSVMRYNNGKLSPREVRSFMATRIVLERLAIETAVKIASNEQIDTLGDYFGRFAEADDDHDFAEAIMDYYHDIHSLGGNVLLPLLFHSFRVPSVNLYERFIAKNGREPVLASARAVLDGLKNRDAARACKASEDILNSAIEGETSII